MEGGGRGEVVSEKRFGVLESQERFAVLEPYSCLSKRSAAWSLSKNYNSRKSRSPRGRDQRCVGGACKESPALLPRGASREMAGEVAMEAQEKEAQVMGAGAGLCGLLEPGLWHARLAGWSPGCATITVFLTLLRWSIFSAAFTICEPPSA